jgi:hypothetical protein
VLVLPATVEVEAARLVLAGFIGAMAFTVARAGGADRGRALLYGAAMLFVGTVVALLKNGLLH